MSGHVQEEYPLVGGYGETRSKWFYVGAIVFVCWNILLFSLAVAAIAKVVRSTMQPFHRHTSKIIIISPNLATNSIRAASTLGDTRRHFGLSFACAWV